MKGSSYIKLSQERIHSSKGLINIKNNDNQCFRWCHIRHLNPQNKDPQRIQKRQKQKKDRAFVQNLDYKNIEFPVTIKQINKIENKTVLTSMYLVMKINNRILFIYQKKNIKIV